MRKLVFVDIETTGLDHNKDSIVELSYCTDSMAPRTLYFGIREVPTFIDDLIGFTKRGLDKFPESKYSEFLSFTKTLRDNTMVAANPSFDKSFLQANRLWTGHYRMLDIESYAMAALNLDHVPSLKEIRETLNEEYGFEGITIPDHTSLSDVMCLRDCYESLRSIGE